VGGAGRSEAGWELIDMDESTLVAAALADPQRGFGAIYDRYGDRIHDYCLAVLRQREDAADAAQDTFLIAYERLGQLRDPGRLSRGCTRSPAAAACGASRTVAASNRPMTWSR
jgi:hypothetical protein